MIKENKQVVWLLGAFCAACLCLVVFLSARWWLDKIGFISCSVLAKPKIEVVSHGGQDWLWIDMGYALPEVGTYRVVGVEHNGKQLTIGVVYSFASPRSGGEIVNNGPLILRSDLFSTEREIRMLTDGKAADIARVSRDKDGKLVVKLIENK
jgi:hypothetical protein